MIKVLSIGTDRKLFESESSVLSRNLQYASKMEELHIIVFTLKNQNLKDFQQGNLFIYSTNSSSKVTYISDAKRLGRKIITEKSLQKNNSVITAQDPFECGIVGKFLSETFKLPLQIQVHTDFLSPYFKNSLLNRFRVFISKFILPSADSLRVVSSVIADSVRQKYPNLKADINILPIWVDVRKIESRSATPIDDYMSKKNIVMASRLTKEKRFDIALKSFKKVVEKDNEVRLTICGQGPEENNINELIKKLGLEANVRIRGWSDPDNLIDHYKMSDVFLLTSEFEGYGMTLIEAGASGCPIVTTKVGLAKTDLFQDGVNSYVCPVGDVECLSEKLLDLIKNPEKRKSFANHMRDNIMNTQISKEDYINTYVSILERTVRK